MSNEEVTILYKGISESLDKLKTVPQCVQVREAILDMLTILLRMRVAKEADKDVKPTHIESLNKGIRLMEMALLGVYDKRKAIEQKGL